MEFIYNLLFLSIALLLANVFFHDKRIDSILLIFSISIVFGLLQYPYSMHQLPSEILSFYVQPLSNKLQGDNVALGNNVMWLYYHVAIYLMDLLGMTSVQIIILLRFLIFFVTLIVLREVVRIICVKSTLVFRGGNVLAYAVFFLGFDFTFNLLLMGDQFRNALGSLFYLLTIYFVFKGYNLSAIVFAILSVLSHKLFIILIPISFLLYYLSTLNISKHKSFYLLMFLLTAPSILMLQFVVQTYFYSFYGFGDKVSHSGINTGLVDALLTKPGVMVAIMYYTGIFFVIFLNFEYIKNSKYLRFFLLFSLLFFIGSKVNIFGVAFVEPARFYYTMAPFLSILLAFSVYRLSFPLRLIFILLYISYNFLLVNLNNESYHSAVVLFKSSLFDINEHVFGGDTLFSIKMLVIFFLLFLLFVVFRNVRLNMRIGKIGRE